MIYYVTTTVFNVKAQTIVNPVNCQGVMGAGLALEFKLRYPAMFTEYQEACRRGELTPGKAWLYRQSAPWILNFPTKDHWRYPSRMSWIVDGLKRFIVTYQELGITSVAFPKLGSQHGRLDWAAVKPVMEDHLIAAKIPVFICLDEETAASGLEGMMVKMINDLARCTPTDSLGLRPDTLDKVRRTLPVQRFFQLAQKGNLPSKTYETVFRAVYQEVIQNEGLGSRPGGRWKEARQLTLNLG